MSFATAATANWRRRHKSLKRRLKHDVRALLPMIGVVFCFVSSASVIVAAERVSLSGNPVINDYVKLSISLTSGLTAVSPQTRPTPRVELLQNLNELDLKAEGGASWDSTGRAIAVGDLGWANE
jgi:hypothetical protein